MRLRRKLNRIRITSAQCNDKRNAVRLGSRHDPAIALFETNVSESELSQSV